MREIGISSVASPLVAFRNLEECWIGFCSCDLIHGHCLAATAGVVVLDQEIDAQIGRVLVLVCNDDLFVAGICGNSLRLADSVG